MSSGLANDCLAWDMCFSSKVLVRAVMFVSLVMRPLSVPTFFDPIFWSEFQTIKIHSFLSFFYVKIYLTLICTAGPVRRNSMVSDSIQFF
jgi:hypothetical protein